MSEPLSCPACRGSRILQGPPYERSACVCMDCGYRFRAWGRLDHVSDLLARASEPLSRKASGEAVRSDA